MINIIALAIALAWAPLAAAAWRSFDVVAGLASKIGGCVGWRVGPDRTTVALDFPNRLAELIK